MSFLRGATRAYLLHRLTRGGRRRNPRGATWHRGHGAPYPTGRGRRSRGRSGFGFFGPLPTYSRRTRRGSRVSVTGCCLPFPLAMSVSAALLVRQALRHG